MLFNTVATRCAQAPIIVALYAGKPELRAKAEEACKAHQKTKLAIDFAVAAAQVNTTASVETMSYTSKYKVLYYYYFCMNSVRCMQVWYCITLQNSYVIRRGCEH
jgi:hypothetical protein